MIGLVALANQGCDNGVVSAIARTLRVVPSELRLEVGQKQRLEVSLVGGSELLAASRTFASERPVIAEVDTFGVVTGMRPGTTQIFVVLRLERSINTNVPVTVVERAAPTIAIQAITLGNNMPVDANNVSGQIDVQMIVERLPISGTFLDVKLGGTTICSLPVAAPASGSLTVKCPIDTAAFDAQTGRARTLNGSTQLTASLVADDRSTLATESRMLRLANGNQVRIAVGSDAPLGPGMQIVPGWKGVDVLVRVVPVMFDNLSVRVSLRGTASNGGAGLDLGSGPGAALTLPAGLSQFVVRRSLNLQAEARYTLTPTLLAENGDPVPIDEARKTTAGVGIDNVSPIVDLQTASASLSLDFDAVVLTYPTGTYAARDTIPLLLIDDGSIGPAHEACARGVHLHGNIRIRGPGPTSPVQGPFADPQDTRGDACGHGEIVKVKLNFGDLRFTGSMRDGAALTVAAYALFAATDGCDEGPVVNDRPVAQGSDPEQADKPAENLFGSAANFSVLTRYYANRNATNVELCARFTARDEAGNETVKVKSVPVLSQIYTERPVHRH
ncbi:MAG: hypothetical protein ACRENP_18505 [Longimicrobiales bacterium]